MKTLILKKQYEWADEGIAYAVFIIDEEGFVIDSSKDYEDLFWNTLEEAINHLANPNLFSMKAFL